MAKLVWRNAIFVERSADEDWASLMSAINDSDAAQDAVLVFVLKRATDEVRELFS